MAPKRRRHTSNAHALGGVGAKRGRATSVFARTQFEKLRQNSRAAGASLLNHLLCMYALQKLSATDFCILCSFAHDSGAPGGDFGLYSVPPGRPSGQCQKHLDLVLPKSHHLEKVKMPCVDRKEAVRSERTIFVSPAQEAIAREARMDWNL